MKLFAKIIKAILIIVLALIVIEFLAVSVLSSTILNESYVFKMLKSSNYYSNIYNEVQSNFENYIGPSGLDENILTDICTVDDIQKDTEIILGNIYEGTAKSIDANAMKEKIISKINASLSDTKLSASVQENIEQFAQKISEEYKNTISHTEYEQQIYNIYSKGVKIVKTMKIASCVCIFTVLVMLTLINLKQLHRTLANIGIALTSSGAFCMISDFIVNSNVRVQNIKVLNDSISTAIQNVITDILSKFTSTGLTLVVVGVILIIVCNIIQAKNTKE